MSIKKDRKDRKEAGIAAKTCRGVGLAKAEGTKSAKTVGKNHRLKARFEFAPALGAFLPLAFLCDLCALFRLFPLRGPAPMFCHPTLFAPFVPSGFAKPTPRQVFAAIPVLSQVGLISDCGWGGDSGFAGTGVVDASSRGASL